MASEAQRRAVKRYEAAGKRPGKIVTVRMDDALLERVAGEQRKGESFGGCLKRLINRGLQMG